MGKITRYFENYQDAYNYYGGTNVPSKEIALVGDASYVFVSSDNSYGGGNTQYFDAGMTNDTIVVTLTENAYTSGSSYGYEQGYAYGYPLGYTDGEAYGYTTGFDIGHQEGYTAGETAGYAAGTSYGYTWGEAQGYENGYTAGTTYGESIGYPLGYEAGYTYGYPLGHQAGYNEGNEAGYATGYTAGTTYGYDWGYPTGYNAGQTYGESIGYVAGQAYGEEIGYAQGYEGGYSYGYSEGVASVPVPTGNVDITTTSQVDVTNYATAQVVDANLTASNIASGVTILGVSGSYTGLVPSGNINITTTSQVDVTNYATAQVVDANLTAGNIASGVTILGVTGSYVDSASYTNGYNAGYTAGTTYGYDYGYPIGYAAGTTYGYAWGQSAGGGGGASLSPDSNLVSYASKQQVFENASLFMPGSPLTIQNSSSPTQSPSQVHDGFYPYFGNWPYYIDTFVPSTNSILPVNIEDVQYYPMGYDENNPDIESIMILIDNVSNDDLIGLSEFWGSETPDPMDPENIVYNVESIYWLIHSIGNGNYSHWYTMTGLSSSNTGVIFKIDYNNGNWQFAISYYEGSSLPTPPEIEPDEPYEE